MTAHDQPLELGERRDIRVQCAQVALEHRVVRQLATKGGCFILRRLGDPFQIADQNGAVGRSVAFVFQQMFGNAPALVFGPDPTGLRHTNIVEKHLAKFRMTIQPLDRANVHSGKVGSVQQQKGDALLFLTLPAGAHQHEHPVRFMGEGCPDLAAVDDVIIPIRDRATFQ